MTRCLVEEEDILLVGAVDAADEGSSAEDRIVMPETLRFALAA